jgi:8-oxo-dGTP diphosphatase
VEDADIPEFGKKDGCAYVPRPGVYAVLFNPEGQIAILKTRLGYYLPGGGSESDEAPEETLQREVQEECGYSIRIGRSLGEAVEYVFADDEGVYFQKQCLFFEALLGENVGKASDDHHTLLWMTPTDAAETLTHRSQVWALGKAVHRLRV